MILKANVDGKGIWQYFENNGSIRTTILYSFYFGEPEIETIIRDHIKKTSEDNEVWDFTERIPFGQEVDKGIIEFWLYDGVKSKFVFSYTQNYILNNEGKTIERI